MRIFYTMGCCGGERPWFGATLRKIVKMRQMKRLNAENKVHIWAEMEELWARTPMDQNSATDSGRLIEQDRETTEPS
jgi:hypothetical protein